MPTFGALVYDLGVLGPKGRVKNVTIDGRTGRILKGVGKKNDTSVMPSFTVVPFKLPLKGKFPKWQKKVFGR